MAVQEKLYTAAEFIEIVQLPENEAKRLELIDGEICEMAPSSKRNTIIAARFVRWLGNHVDTHNLGYVTGADGGYKIGQHDVFLPDAAFITKERAVDLSGVEFPVAPDLAVEVISPSETSRNVLDKVRAYLQAGTQLVWTVYPEDKVIDVCGLGENGSLIIQTVRMDGELSGGDVLPGFTIKVSDVFAGLSE